MEVKDRIKFLMDSVKMSQQDFARILGITPGSLSGILNERTKPTNKHTLAIHKAFPDININWLLFGEGDMYSENNTTNDAGINSNTEDDLQEKGINSLLQHQTSLEFDFDTNNHVQNVADERMETIAPSTKLIKRCVKEIRLFYDDGTYESFVSSEK